MDAAIKKGDMNALSLTVQSINYLAAQSPFAALGNVQNIKQSLINNDPIDL